MSMNDGPMENSSSNELTSPSYSYEPPSAPDNGDGGVASGAAIYPQPPALPTSTIPVVDPARDKSQSELYVGGGD